MRIVRRGLTEDEKRQHARQLNLARRHLDRAQKRGLIAAQLKDTPEKSNRQVAAGLKVDHKTVQAVRQEAERRGEIPHVSKTVDKSGRYQEAKRPPKEPKVSRRVVLDPEFQALAEQSARDIEIERDERIALSGSEALVEENNKLLKQVAALNRRLAAVMEEKNSAQYREKMWKERAIEAGWKARADA